jgi:hypothetical protein
MDKVAAGHFFLRVSFLPVSHRSNEASYVQQARPAGVLPQRWSTYSPALGYSQNKEVEQKSEENRILYLHPLPQIKCLNIKP